MRAVTVLIALVVASVGVTYAKPGGDGYAKSKKHDPYGEKKHDPYGEKKHDPYGEKKHDPYGDGDVKKDPNADQPIYGPGHHMHETVEKDGQDIHVAHDGYVMEPMEHMDVQDPGVHVHESFVVGPNMDAVVNVTNQLGHVCAFHFTTGNFQGDEQWDLLLFDVTQHHECSAVHNINSDEEKMAEPASVFTSAALVVKDERGSEFTIAGSGASPADAELEFTLGATDIGHGLHSTDSFKNKLFKIAINFLPRKDEF